MSSRRREQAARSDGDAALERLVAERVGVARRRQLEPQQETATRLGSARAGRKGAVDESAQAVDLRRLRRVYAAQVDHLRGVIDRAFPAGTRAAEPSGGFLLWLELPPECDANALCDEALERGITITPGSLFSPSGRHRQHLRLSACHHFSERYVHALLTLGDLAQRQVEASPTRRTSAA